jgi:hypothetical protein
LAIALRGKVMDSEKHNQEQSIIEIIKSGELNTIYFNEFAIGVSKSDTLI